MSAPNIDRDIFSNKYLIKEMFLYPLGKDNDKEYKIDLRGMFSSCELYESLFQPFLEFRITLLDTLGVLRNIPLRGGELLKLKFEMVSDIIEKTIRTYEFRMVTYSKVTQKDHTETYNPMVFMSKQYFYNLSSRVNWAYPQGTEIKSIVNDLCTKLLRITDEKKEFKGHDTNSLGSSKANQIAFTNITPLECIYKLIPFTNLKEDNKLCDFLFYESLQEGDKIALNYHSVNKLIKDSEIKWTFMFYPMQNSFYKDEKEKDVKMISYFRDKKIIPVTRFEIKDSKDNIKSIENSLAGGAVYSLNILTKQFRKSEMDTDNLHKQSTRINKTPWMIQDESKHFFTFPSKDERPQHTLQQYNVFKLINYNVFNKDVRDPNTDLIRKFNYNVLDQSQLNVEIPGISNLYLGCRTKFNVPEVNVESVNGKNTMNKSYETSVNFFVVAIKHMFSAREYRMIINLCADGEFTKEIHDRFDKDKKDWNTKSSNQFDGSQEYLPGYHGH